jgi:HPt (histidine-containing phosphotransfer) domain-containing protein
MAANNSKDTPPNDPDLVDWKVANAATDGDQGILTVIAEAAVAELPVLIEKLRDSLTRRDAKNLEFAGHKLKGALRPFGAQRPYGLAIKLMNMGKDGELEGAEQLVEQLEPDVCDVVKILRAFLDRDPKG